ncbi:MAG: multiprotein bridging factor aMBF1 [Candidatus Thermoplasmatota archaeon]|jgi:putative transcription factor|nr:multiprotein bridging factor aMBF1 [Candidatus Thermoplasmatota archaeon]
MQCELCGKTCDCKAATIDGVMMMLCPNCIKHGQVVQTTKAPAPIEKPSLDRIKKPPVKDIYKDMIKELVTGWNELIKKAREKKGLTREELGFKIGERTVTISKIENGDLRPPDKVIEKLEKELGIKLFEDVSDVSTSLSTSRLSGSLTLGDFIKK